MHFPFNSIHIRPMSHRPVSAILIAVMLMMGSTLSCFGQSDVTTYRVMEHVVDSGMVRRTGESISFPYKDVQVVQDRPNNVADPNNPSGRLIGTFDIYKVRGDKKATALFEFLANNVVVFF